MVDTGSWEVYLKHKAEALRTRFLNLASEDAFESDTPVKTEIDEILKNYMDVSTCNSLNSRDLQYNFRLNILVRSQSVHQHKILL